MSRMAVISFLAMACANAFSAQMASQQWVMNRIEEATNNISGASGYATIEEVNAKISTNNDAFVEAVLAVPLAGADEDDLAEIGGYGTVGAALLALIAGLVALKRRVGDAETAIAGKASVADLPYALVTPGEWEFSGVPEDEEFPWSVSSGPTLATDSGGETIWKMVISNGQDPDLTYESSAGASQYDLTIELRCAGQADITATRASLPGHLCDRANNLIDATTGNVTLTLPAYQEGKVRDLLVACTIGLDTNDEPWSVIFQGQGSEAPSGADEISFKAEGDDAASATFPVPDAAGDWWYSLTERAPHVFAVSLKQLQSVSQPTQTQGGS